jgi:hypothetical protein
MDHTATAFTRTVRAMPPVTQSSLGKNFNLRNINHMLAVKIFVRLELDETISFLDGHRIRF